MPVGYGLESTGLYLAEDGRFLRLEDSAVTNVLSNPSFEVTDTPWGATGAATSARVVGSAQDGSAYLLFTSGATGTATLISETIPTTPGSVWSAGYYAMSDAGTARQVRLDIQFIDSGGGVISSSLGTATLVTGSWVQATNLNRTAPALTTGVRIRMSQLSSVAGDAYRIDAVQLEPGATVPAYNG